MKFRQVHLDFHTSEHIPGIGAEFDRKQFQDALNCGHVNSITVFSKCHHGWSYHPTQCNRMHPGLSFDLLKAQIEAAHEIGVNTPVYLSAGYDEKCAAEHPEWLLRTKDGKTNRPAGFSEAGYHLLCFNSPYLDRLVEQVKEICRNYDADGIFMDITSPRVCYCHNCVKGMRELGLDPYDEKNARAYGERVYAKYTKAIRDAVDSVKPGLPVFHNAGNTPIGRRDIAAMSSHNEIESLPTGGWGYDNYPSIVRYVQPLGMEYLGMTGKFHLTWGEFGGYKHPNALIYENGLTVAHGGKCSVGDQLHPRGKMDPETYRIIGEVYQKIEEREPWLDGVKAVSDIGFLSYNAWLLRHPQINDSDCKLTDLGVLRILMEEHYLFDVLDEESDFSPYKVLILPDNIRIDGPLYEKLQTYVAGGGKLLACGTSGLETTEEGEDFAFDFGVRYEGLRQVDPVYLTPCTPIGGMGIADYVAYAPSTKICLTDGEMICSLTEPYFARNAEHFCSHHQTPADPSRKGVGAAVGKHGVYIASQVFRDYANIGTLFLKRLVSYALDRCLASEKTLSVELPSQGTVTLMDQTEQGRMVLHLLYAPRTVKGAKKIEVIEDCVPLYDVPVTLFPGNRKVRRMYTAPGGEEIGFVRNPEGQICFTVPRTEIHSMTVIDYTVD